MLNFAEKVKFGRNDYVVTYKGVDGKGRFFFAFIICDATSYDQMKIDYENNMSVPDIRKYGEILYVDFQREPDDAALKLLDLLIENKKAG